MGVNINCEKCRRTTQAVMEPKTEAVFCEDCNTEVKANHFLKVQLKALKQFRQKKQAPFAVKCEKCNNTDTPVANKGELYCSKCKATLNVTAPFKNMFLLQNKSKEEL